MVAVDDELAVADFDRIRERPMRGVVTRKMRIGFGIAEIVDGDNDELAATLALVDRA
jgi:hypothetical protein